MFPAELLSLIEQHAERATSHVPDAVAMRERSSEE